MEQAFEAVGGTPVPGSALDQACLLDGTEVVEDYLAHGEPLAALEHLVYMIREPPLAISDATYALIAEAARQLNMAARWEDIDPSRQALPTSRARETH